MRVVFYDIIFYICFSHWSTSRVQLRVCWLEAAKQKLVANIHNIPLQNCQRFSSLRSPGPSQVWLNPPSKTDFSVSRYSM